MVSHTNSLDGLSAPPYPPSWLDRITAWVDRLPGPYWAYYLGLGLVLFATETALKWKDGVYPVGTFQLRHLNFAVWGIYILAAIHYLDRYAAQAMQSFRPALDPNKTNYESLVYQLTTSSATKTLLASLAYLLWGIYSAIWNPSYIQTMQLYISPLATAFELPLIATYYFITGAALYHVVHLLVMVDRIYTVSTRIDPISPQPLYSLASLASRIAFATLAVQYLYIITVPSVFQSSSALISTALTALLAIVLLVWPLWGIHRLLLQEKIRLQTEAQQRMKAVMAELHSRVDASDFTQLDGPNKAMTSLQLEMTLLEKLPTWPWQPDTPRWLLSAILIPMTVWIVQRLLSRFGI